MFPVNFHKKKTLYYLDSLVNSKDIKPQDPSGWTVNEMAALAGVCFFVISTHGPLIRQTAAQMQGNKIEPSEHPEHREADDEMILNDLHAAVEFIGNLSMQLSDGHYDETFEEFVQCGVTQEGEMSKRVVPISGFKEF